MIPKECKRLAEVDFPIAVVSRHSAREKSIRHGHPSTLHLWWARRPLAACRAMLMALLLPDPCDENCPEDFKQGARNVLPRVQGASGPTDLDLRNELLRFIGDFASWDNSANPTYLEAARGLVRAAHGEETPLVVDPFAGGSSIPLEALRIGCDAFASDLNPVACLILKTMLEDSPRLGHKLADELRALGQMIRNSAEKELAEFYPRHSDGAKPIAYIWARTVACDSCGAEIPLVHSFWLSKKSKAKYALRYAVSKREAIPEITFEVFTPKQDEEVPPPTVSRANATCIACHVVLPAARVRSQLTEKRGGTDDAKLLAVVVTVPGHSGRVYRAAHVKEIDAYRHACEKLNVIATATLPNGLSVIPQEPIPLMSGTFNVPLYGVNQWGDMFNPRQKLALTTLASLIGSVKEFSMEAKEVAALGLSRFADICNAFLLWKSTSTQAVHMFSRQALPMVWDYPEPAIFGDASGDFGVTLNTMARVIDAVSVVGRSGVVKQADACSSPLPDESAAVWFTDPPYYFAVPYADLSDFFLFG